MFEEPRSWEPVLKIDPITKSRPTNADLAAGINQVHECFEDHKRTTAQDFRNVKHEIKELRDTLKPKGKKVAGLSSDWESFRRTFYAAAASITTFVVGYKLCVVLFPSVVLAVKALDHAMRTGGL